MGWNIEYRMVEFGLSHLPWLCSNRTARKPQIYCVTLWSNPAVPVSSEPLLKTWCLIGPFQLYLYPPTISWLFSFASLFRSPKNQIIGLQFKDSNRPDSTAVYLTCSLKKCIPTEWQMNRRRGLARMNENRDRWNEFLSLMSPSEMCEMLIIFLPVLDSICDFDQGYISCSRYLSFFFPLQLPRAVTALFLSLLFNLNFTKDLWTRVRGEQKILHFFYQLNLTSRKV